MSNKVRMTLSMALIALMLAASAWAWFAAPQITQIAVHWNFSGEAVAYRSKEVALALAPAAALVLTLVMALASGGSSGSDVQSKRFRAFWTAGLFALALVHTFLVLNAAGIATTFGNYTALGPAAFLGVMGNYIAKGAVAGTATRWAGRILVLTSIAVFVVWAAIPGPAAEVVLGAGVLIAVLAVAMGRSSRQASNGHREGGI